tara:strand:- start:7980 stop:8825 length:846 start_codon:yes stop_codon:yes gene_type:complete
MQEKELKTSPNRKTLLNQNIIPSKKLGQNFIFDSNVLNKIAKQIQPAECDIVIEIGPGLGSLSKELLKEGAKKLLLIEKDTRFLPLLEELRIKSPNKVILENSDALDFNFSEIKEKKVRIISNLPYNISTKLLTTLLFAREKNFFYERMVLMFQKQVAQRIIAKHNCKEYGRLTILSQSLNKCKILFDLKPDIFYPKPKVESSLVMFEPIGKDLIDFQLQILEFITKHAFSQRRKKIKAGLREVINEHDLIEKYKINPDLRPEELSVKDYLRISSIYEKNI